jgi:hypothetical protein
LRFPLQASPDQATLVRALELLSLATQIIAWIEDLLEPKDRRIILAKQPQVEITQVVIAPS